MKKKLLFIINPISGQGNRKKTISLIQKSLDKNKYNFFYVFTEYPYHAVKICNNIDINKYYGVIAVGGDGTVNECLKGLLGKNIKLGIVPCGSGNGLARHLRIPLNLKGAIKRINENRSLKIDAGSVNDNVFVNVAGIGFDAKVAQKFSQSKNRGFISYIKIVLKEYFRYKEQNFVIQDNGTNKNVSAFFICIANSSQFGNNIVIAPTADISDDWLNVCIVKKPNLLQLPHFLYLLFINQVNKSELCSEFKRKKLIIEQKQDLIHLDGEPAKLGKKLNISIASKKIEVFF